MSINSSSCCTHKTRLGIIQRFDTSRAFSSAGCARRLTAMFGKLMFKPPFMALSRSCCSIC